MVFVGYAGALFAFYYWIKSNWFVPLVMLAGLTTFLSAWGKFNWPDFFELAGVCYAPIILRFFIRGFAADIHEEMHCVPQRGVGLVFLGRAGYRGQAAKAGMLTVRSSLNGAMVSRVM